MTSVYFFLEAFSWDTGLWVTLGDFTDKKKQKQKQKQGESVFTWKLIK